MPARLSLVPDPSGLSGCDSLVFVGRAERLVDEDVLRLVPSQVGEATWRQMVKKTDAGDAGRVATTWTSGSPARVSAAVLPEPCSRHNAPSHAGSIPGLLGSAAQKGNVAIVLCLTEREQQWRAHTTRLERAAELLRGLIVLARLVRLASKRLCLLAIVGCHHDCQEQPDDHAN